MDKREFAQKVGQLNWNDLIKDPNKISVEMLWRIYSGLVFEGKTIGRTQYAETKQAFYIGFSEAFKFMTDMSERLPEDVACGVLTNISREVNAFVRDAVNRKFDGAPGESNAPRE